jgi:hypothetical protein
MQNKKTVIGIAGTAKNTGKTTTLNCLLKEAERRNMPVAVTGIGFDGEEQDNVTLLPKPRVTVYPNSIVTTSEQCLDISTAKVEILQRTGIFTSLGEILVMRILQTGLIVIAGPSKRKDLEIVIEKMIQYNVDCIFVDGSLNRISPMSVVHSIIFTTGASRSTDIAILSNEMKAIEYLFQLPSSHYNVDFKTMTIPLLLDSEDVEGLKELFTKEHTTLFVSKMISLAALERLTWLCLNSSIPLQHLIFPDPFTLLITENILQAYKHISKLVQSNISVTYRNAPKLSCITANPFFPHYIGNKYYSEYIDRTELMVQLRSSCSTPIFNTQETEPSVIFDIWYR